MNSASLKAHRRLKGRKNLPDGFHCAFNVIRLQNLRKASISVRLSSWATLEQAQAHLRNAYNLLVIQQIVSIYRDLSDCISPFPPTAFAKYSIAFSTENSLPLKLDEAYAAYFVIM